MFTPAVEAKNIRCPEKVEKNCLGPNCMAWIQDVPPFRKAILYASGCEKLLDVTGNQIIFPTCPADAPEGQPSPPDYDEKLTAWIEAAEKVAKMWSPLYKIGKSIPGASIHSIYVDDVDLDIVAIIQVPNDKASLYGYCGKVYHTSAGTDDT